MDLYILFRELYAVEDTYAALTQVIAVTNHEQKANEMLAFYRRKTRTDDNRARARKLLGVGERYYTVPVKLTERSDDIPT